ncbi:MAG: hypothetical protein NC311_09160 [Muribaculaceae bacterium]|nr:hypothetical protein [Muribaculaceae bacterium]
MQTMNKNGLFKYCNQLSNTTLSVALGVFIAYNIAPASAAVVQRTTPAATTATTPRPASQRMPTMTAKLATVTSSTTTTDGGDTGNSGTTDTTTTTDSDDTPVQDANQIIEDKTSQFDSVLNTASTGATDASTQSLADMIRAQRAALDAATSEEFSQNKTNVVTAGLSACDSGLRACMKEKCGADFLKCAGDGDTIWGDKMDLCRRNVTCSGEEYRLFTTEIKADRDMNFRMSRYQAVIDCGNSYNACIEEQCGATFNKCLGKAAGDAAIAKCASIARDCTEQDSGLAARAMNVFATLRQDAEKQIKRDEERLYELRDTMRNRCQRLGALFDERSLDCVFTVEFWAGGSPSTLYASKKAYAGSTFDCTQNWFGVDITTFKENAYRETRAQTSATSALLGSGLGIAVGSITSGAIDRAVDRHKAEQAVKKAEKEDEQADKARSQGYDTEEQQEESEEKQDNGEKQSKKEAKKEDKKQESKKDEKKDGDKKNDQSKQDGQSGNTQQNGQNTQNDNGSNDTSSSSSDSGGSSPSGDSTGGATPGGSGDSGGGSSSGGDTGGSTSK